MPFVRRVALTGAMLLALLGAPCMAYADVAEYQVQFTPTGDTGTAQVIVNVVLTPAVSLPATVSVPLPAGAQILWAGEILGGDPAADPSREYTIVPAAGGQIVRFRMEQVRVAQVEAALAPPEVTGGAVHAPLRWTNTTEAGTYTFSVVLEPAISDVRIVPAPIGEPKRNSRGESLYTLPPVRLEQGQTFDVDVRYIRGSVGARSSSVRTTVLAVAGAALALVTALLIVLVRRQRAHVG